mmetsp:Transcript_21450/g.44602  ORF Transcript_21450/g.44602 Transcript_21450/m.44602 type:complete len:170 (-) Transcript_21450:229-738(-)|eukprot:CAMPEP_0171403600 /NCGR_PEP_ID=MMETSP0880-20121228/11529_1 /TAXON_ID=67004 /ORGANISM="Thalassiosira weissflogii, Strain CCMP1336" /LENGTH=169 /DNA_ID=CAMNT_0011918597 /DNA_START=40 /DNA_END=549 /DNA_ORIENTATION=+
MSFSGAIRRSAKRLSEVNWSSPVFKGDNELSAMVAGFRAWTAQADAMAEKYSAPPAPIDFAAAKKSVRDVSLVEALEKMYTANKPAPLTYEWSADEQAVKAQLIEDAKAGLAFTQEMIEDTQKEIAFMRVNRTTRETSAIDVKENYPDIAEEVEKEIEDREWFKDTIGK